MEGAGVQLSQESGGMSNQAMAAAVPKNQEEGVGVTL